MTQVNLDESKIKLILQGITIPPQPQVMVDLQIEQCDPLCSVETVSKLILQDMGLSGSILKTVNSPYFNIKNNISSINQAISLMGIDSVVNVVNSLSIKSALADESIVNMTRFWDSAMDIAAASAFISRSVEIAVPDEAYTLGLFHNCGNILMLQKFPGFSDILGKCYAEQKRRVTDIENDEFKTNHAVVGYYVAKSWKLPKTICQAVALHHSTKDIFLDHEYDDDELKALLAVLKMAEHICGIHRILGAQEVDFEWQAIESDVLDYMHITESDFQALVDNIADLGLVDSRHINFAA